MRTKFKLKWDRAEILMTGSLILDTRKIQVRHQYGRSEVKEA